MKRIRVTAAATVADASTAAATLRHWPRAALHTTPFRTRAAAAAAVSEPASAERVAARVAHSQPFLNSYRTAFDADTIQQLRTTTPAESPRATPPADAPPAVAAPSAARPLMVSVKANFCIGGHVTSAGSRMLSDFVSPYDATVVRRLRRDPAVVVTGSTNMDEFGMGSFNANSPFGIVINPWSYRNCKNEEEMKRLMQDESHLLTAGGSSGGAAASVAGGTCDAAIGSDTGGSVRLPAAYCGLVGLKPSYGRVSRYGLIAYASSMDTPGVLARNASDARRLLNIVEGHEPRDATSIEGLEATPADSGIDSAAAFPASPSSTSAARKQRRVFEGMTIGVPAEYNIAELSPAVRDAWFRWCALLAEESGARVVSVSLPSTQAALPAYYILAPAEAMSNLSRYDGARYGFSASKNGPAAAQPASNLASSRGGTFVGPPAQTLKEYYISNRSAAFGDEVQRRILLGGFVLSSEKVQEYYERSQRVRRLVADEFAQMFAGTAQRNKIDLLLTPTAIDTAPSFRRIAEERRTDPVAPYLNDVFTIPSNLAGIPALSVPAGLDSNGLPIGLQLLGDYHSEHTLLRVAEWMQHRAREDGMTFDSGFARLTQQPAH